VLPGSERRRAISRHLPSRRAAERAGQREEQRVREGRWHDYSLGATTFREYVEDLAIEQTHRTHDSRCLSLQSGQALLSFLRQPPNGADPAVERSGLGDHGDCSGSHSEIRAEVPRHAALDLPASGAGRTDLDQSMRAHGAVQGRVASIEELTPEEFDQLIQAIPKRHRLMVETAIETGMRWGELIALRPRHIDFLRRHG
jgi:Phage integrase family